MLLGNNNLKGKSVADILAMAKASPKPWTLGVASTTAHVVYGMLADATKVELVRVPYAAGNRNMFTDLMRGDIDLVIEAMPSAMAPITNGQVTAIAVTNPTRSAFLPDVPTFKESGIDVSLLGWNAFYVPRGTPPEDRRRAQSRCQRSTQGRGASASASARSLPSRSAAARPSWKP